MKTKRGLSGIYFRVKIENSTRFENRTFEDLTEAQQDEVLVNKCPAFVASLARQLANTLNDIGEQFELTTEPE